MAGKKQTWTGSDNFYLSKGSVDETLQRRLFNEFGISKGDFGIKEITTSPCKEYELITSGGQKGLFCNTVIEPLPGGLHAEIVTTAFGFVRDYGNMSSDVHIGYPIALGNRVDFIAVVGHELCHAIHNHMIPGNDTMFSERAAFKHEYNTYIKYGMTDKALEIKNKGYQWSIKGQYLWGDFPPEYEIGWCLKVYESASSRFLNRKPLQIKGFNI